MPPKRRIDRHDLPYYLKVFNQVTDKPIGYIGNISLDGILLISHLPMMVGAKFELRLKIPSAETISAVNFTGICQWTREDVNPGSYDSGFSIVAPPPDFVELVEALRMYFRFGDLSNNS